MKRMVEEAHSLRKAAPHAGKTLLRLNHVGTRVGLQPHAVSQACAAFFVRSERRAPKAFLRECASSTVNAVNNPGEDLLYENLAQF